MFGARILLDSIAPSGARLTTFEVTFPRIVLAEFNTHRMFSRNSASSRAIPVKTMLERVAADPFIPYYWGKNQKGMQAEEELSEQQIRDATLVWSLHRDRSIEAVKTFESIGVHKQIANRLLEAHLWHTVIFTATEMDNYYALRNDKHAQPEIRKPTEMLLELYEASKPMELESGEWHLPLVTNYELFFDEGCKPRGWKRTLAGVETRGDVSVTEWLDWAKISAGRCARVSYLTHEGKRDLDEDTRMHDNLVANGHMSPLEHPAMALTHIEWQRQAQEQFAAWRDLRIPMGNFWGWHQYRKMLVNEHNFKLVKKETA